MTDSSFQQVIGSMTREVWSNMRRAVELGRWPDGRRLTGEQRELCLQAIIAWEVGNLPEEERSGYVPPHCHDREAQLQTVTLRPARRAAEGAEDPENAEKQGDER